MPEKGLPKISCTLRFEAAPKRSFVGGTYRPHVVLEDVAEPTDKDHLGVAFVAGPKDAATGQEAHAEFVCLYHPKVDYSRLVSGARFRLVEGAQVVAEGVVDEAPSTLDHAETKRILKRRKKDEGAAR